MKKKHIIIIITLAIMLFVTGCNTTTTVSYTYKAETGDEIKVSLNAADGYGISSEVPFKISKDGKEISQGTFIAVEYYDTYVESIEKDAKAKILSKGDTETCSYVMWNYDNSEYNYVIKINESKTGVLLGNRISEETAKEVFNRLKIEVNG